MGADAGGGKGGISAGGGDGVGGCNVVVVGDDVIDETGGVVIDGGNTVLTHGSFWLFTFILCPQRGWATPRSGCNTGATREEDKASFVHTSEYKN